MAFKGGEEQIAKILGDEAVICSAHAQRTPDFLDTLALENEDPTWQPATKIGGLFFLLRRERAVEKCDQLASQAFEQPDRGLGLIAQKVVGVWKQVVRRVQSCEIREGVVEGPGLASLSGAEPDDDTGFIIDHPFIDPCRPAVRRDPNAVHHRAVDRKNSLLTGRRIRSYAPKLIEQRMVNVAKVDIEAWQLDVEITDEATDRRPGTAGIWHGARIVT